MSHKVGTKYSNTLTGKQANKARWLLNVNFTAVMLCEELGEGISPQKLRYLEERHGFPARRIDGKLFYNGLEVAAWAKKLVEGRNRKFKRNRAILPEGWAYCGRCKKSNSLNEIDERIVDNPKFGKKVRVTIGLCSVCGKKVTRLRTLVDQPAFREREEMKL